MIQYESVIKTKGHDSDVLVNKKYFMMSVVVVPQQTVANKGFC